MNSVVPMARRALRLCCAAFAQMRPLSIGDSAAGVRPDSIIKSAIVGVSLAMCIGMSAHSLAASDPCTLAPASCMGGCSPAFAQSDPASTSLGSSAQGFRNTVPFAAFDDSADPAITLDRALDLGYLFALDIGNPARVRGQPLDFGLLRAGSGRAPATSAALAAMVLRLSAGHAAPNAAGGPDLMPVPRAEKVEAHAQTTVPIGVSESASLGLISVGMAGLVFARRRRNSGLRRRSAAQRPRRES